MYWRLFGGKYSYEKYHEANEDKLEKFGSVVREDVLWNFPLIHVFDSKVAVNVLISIKLKFGLPRILTISSEQCQSIHLGLQMKQM